MVYILQSGEPKHLQGASVPSKPRPRTPHFGIKRPLIITALLLALHQMRTVLSAYYSSLKLSRTVSIGMKHWRDQSYKVPAGGAILMVAFYPNVSQVCHLRPKKTTYMGEEEVVYVVK